MTKPHAAVVAVLFAAVTLAATAFGDSDSRRLERPIAWELTGSSAGASRLAAPHGTEALGFDLATSTRSDVDAWIGLQNISCQQGRYRYSCAGVAVAGSEARYDELVFRFDSRGHLRRIDAVRSIADVTDAQQHVADVGSRIHESIGAATASNDAGRDTLAMRYGRVHRVYRYDGVVAELTATNLCVRGIRIHESYSASQAGTS
jgi:hypothetical protein